MKITLSLLCLILKLSSASVSTNSEGLGLKKSPRFCSIYDLAAMQPCFNSLDDNISTLSDLVMMHENEEADESLIFEEMDAILMNFCPDELIFYISTLMGRSSLNVKVLSLFAQAFPEYQEALILAAFEIRNSSLFVELSKSIPFSKSILNYLVSRSESRDDLSFINEYCRNDGACLKEAALSVITFSRKDLFMEFRSKATLTLMECISHSIQYEPTSFTTFLIELFLEEKDVQDDEAFRAQCMAEIAQFLKNEGKSVEFLSQLTTSLNGHLSNLKRKRPVSPKKVRFYNANMPIRVAVQKKIMEEKKKNANSIIFISCEDCEDCDV